MTNKTGYATLRGNKLQFNDIGWAMVKEAARKAKKSPKTVVIAGLKRGLKLEKAKKG